MARGDGGVSRFVPLPNVRNGLSAIVTSRRAGRIRILHDRLHTGEGENKGCCNQEVFHGLRVV